MKNWLLRKIETQEIIAGVVKLGCVDLLLGAGK